MTLSQIINVIFENLYNVNSFFVKNDLCHMAFYFINYETDKNQMIQDFIKDLIPINVNYKISFLTKKEFLIKMVYEAICPETIMRRQNKRVILV